LLKSHHRHHRQQIKTAKGDRDEASNTDKNPQAKKLAIDKHKATEAHLLKLIETLTDDSDISQPYANNGGYTEDGEVQE
jgi:hypothetical protein